MDVGEEPPISLELEAFLNSPCPLYPGSGKKVRETHLLTLIPATVKKVDSESEVIEEPYCLDTLGELIQHPLQGPASKYASYHVTDDDKVNAPVKSYWVLLSRDVLPNSCNKTYAKQLSQIEAIRQGYELPGMLEVATSILMEHARSGQRLYGARPLRSDQRLYENSPLTYTRCQELGSSGHMFVGGLSPSGLDFLNYFDDDCYGCNGVGVQRKFS